MLRDWQSTDDERQVFNAAAYDSRQVHIGRHLRRLQFASVSFNSHDVAGRRSTVRRFLLRSALTLDSVWTNWEYWGDAQGAPVGIAGLTSGCHCGKKASTLFQVECLTKHILGCDLVALGQWKFDMENSNTIVFGNTTKSFNYFTSMACCFDKMWQEIWRTSLKQHKVTFYICVS